MSLIPLTAVLGVAIGFFSVPIPVQDVTYAQSGGQDAQTPSASRTINGMVELGNARRMEYLFGGSVSDGDIGIYTSDPLYIDDMYATGATRKQSFVTYQGFQYRVSEVKPWVEQTGFNVYLAKRHVTQIPGGY